MSFGDAGGYQQPAYGNLFSQSSGAGNPLAYPLMPSQDTKDLLKRQFGIDFPEIQQNPLLTNSTAAAHPLLKFLSNVILGGALTPGPQAVEGAGQGMARAMQGILGVPAARRQFQASQIQAPFQMADQIGGFQALEQIKNLRTSEMNLNDASAGATTRNAATNELNAKNRGDYDAALAQARQERIEKEEILRGKPYPAGTDADGNAYSFVFNKDTKDWETRMLTGPNGQKLTPAQQKASRALRSGNLLQVDEFLNDPNIDDKTKAPIQAAVDLYVKQQGLISGNRATAAEVPRKSTADIARAQKEQDETEIWKEDRDGLKKAMAEMQAADPEHTKDLWQGDAAVKAYLRQHNNLYNIYQRTHHYQNQTQSFSDWHKEQFLAGPAQAGPAMNADAAEYLKNNQ